MDGGKGKIGDRAVRSVCSVNALHWLLPLRFFLWGLWQTAAMEASHTSNEKSVSARLTPYMAAKRVLFGWLLKSHMRLILWHEKRDQEIGGNGC